MYHISSQSNASDGHKTRTFLSLKIRNIPQTTNQAPPIHVTCVSGSYDLTINDMLKYFFL